ncbi:hypothetical protein [Actinacidiphila acididurans]|uniref:Phage integrase family protein n=1 Tax=Actinacidiphila acididurans TaxID=2784346 RepID=A0ABS2TRS6_9ACTN|nr:hypothetical protein [Actinacidiphila acididurans]
MFVKVNDEEDRGPDASSVGGISRSTGRHSSERLKRRARGKTRSIPTPPVLVELLRDHLEAHGTAPDGRLFRAAEGGHVLSKEYGEVWQEARKKALTPEDAKTPLADVPYSLRHAGVSLWLSSGVEPTEVARRAGHSVAVLFLFYAKVVKGRQTQDNERIARALAEADDDAP